MESFLLGVLAGVGLAFVATLVIRAFSPKAEKALDRATTLPGDIKDKL